MDGIVPGPEDSDAFQMETLPRLAALLTECAVGGPEAGPALPIRMPRGKPRARGTGRVRREAV